MGFSAFVVLQWKSMGNTSSMLTQYDIEGVQEHCNLMIFSRVCLSLPLFFTTEFPSSCSFSARNSILVSKILSTWSKFKRFHFCWWVLIGSWVCNESTFPGMKWNFWLKLLINITSFWIQAWSPWIWYDDLLAWFFGLCSETS